MDQKNTFNGQMSNTLNELDDILKGDSLLFHNRLNLIKNEISIEVKPNGPISRDHFRTNANGVSLD